MPCMSTPKPLAPPASHVFLHGLCALAAIALDLARDLGAHPADLTQLAGRFAAPVFPGDRLAVHARGHGRVDFEATTGERRVITGGSVSFGDTEQSVSSQGAQT